jgi:hypothetical protein
LGARDNRPGGCLLEDGENNAATLRRHTFDTAARTRKKEARYVGAVVRGGFAGNSGREEPEPRGFGAGLGNAVDDAVTGKAGVGAIDRSIEHSDTDCGMALGIQPQFLQTRKKLDRGLETSRWCKGSGIR